jgi:hypothetical protein
MWGPGVGAGATAAWNQAASDGAAPRAGGAAAATGAALASAAPAVAVPPAPGAPTLLGVARQWEELDLALAIEAAGVSAGASGAAWQSGAAAGAARLAAPAEPARRANAPAPAASSSLRCLDSEHLPGCDRHASKSCLCFCAAGLFA